MKKVAIFRSKLLPPSQTFIKEQALALREWSPILTGYRRVEGGLALGSHLHYDYRYPPAFACFKPTVSDKSSTAPHWQRVTNSYDNTIVYTDHVLAQIIGVLKASHTTHEDRSLFSPAWKPHTRWVNEFWTVNFDHAKVGSGCQKLTPAASTTAP